MLLLLTVSDQTGRCVFQSSSVECLTQIDKQLSRCRHAGQSHHLFSGLTNRSSLLSMIMS
jgi:hypothetical protein